MSPTEELYDPLTIAYKHLFDNELPPVIFTLQRKKNVMGIFLRQSVGEILRRKCVVRSALTLLTLPPPEL